MHVHTAIPVLAEGTEDARRRSGEYQRHALNWQPKPMRQENAASTEAAPNWRTASEKCPVTGSNTTSDRTMLGSEHGGPRLRCRAKE